jgi:hypothetical protein
MWIDENFSSAPFLNRIIMRERGGEESEEFFGIYRFIAHEHSVAELIFHIIKGGKGCLYGEKGRDLPSPMELPSSSPRAMMQADEDGFTMYITSRGGRRMKYKEERGSLEFGHMNSC